jgi:hypothetical protein
VAPCCLCLHLYALTPFLSPSFLCMAPKNPTSLLDSSFHSPALLELVSQEPVLNVYRKLLPPILPAQIVTFILLVYIANKAMMVVLHALPDSPNASIFPHPDQFRLFVTNFFTASSSFGVGMNIILTALVLMQRVDNMALRGLINRKSQLRPCHFVFVSSALLAIKVSTDNDSSPCLINFPFFFHSLCSKPHIQ